MPFWLRNEHNVHCSVDVLFNVGTTIPICALGILRLFLRRPPALRPLRATPLLLNKEVTSKKNDIALKQTAAYVVHKAWYDSPNLEAALTHEIHQRLKKCLPLVKGHKGSLQLRAHDSWEKFL